MRLLARVGLATGLGIILVVSGLQSGVNTFVFAGALPAGNTERSEAGFVTINLAAGSGVAVNRTPVFTDNSLLVPANGATLTSTAVFFDWKDATGGDIVSYTLVISRVSSTLEFTSTVSAYTPTQRFAGDTYSWTVQAHDAISQVSGFVTPPNTFTVQAVPSFSGNPLLTPANGATFGNPFVSFDWADAGGEVMNYTLRITRPGGSLVDYVTTPSQKSVLLPANGTHTWSVRANNYAGESGPFIYSRAFTLENATWYAYLPAIIKSPPSECPLTSNNSYTVIPFLGSPENRPPPLHADLNLSLRSYNLTSAPQTLIGYNGGTDSNAPRLDGLFSPNNYPGISSVYRVNNWNWGCGAPEGCPAGPITDWDVTLMGLSATAGDQINIPERGPNIYGGGYKVLVLYAEEKRITLGYTRDPNIVNGYSVHLENICVDPNLLALYQAQTDSEGKHNTGHLPALRNDEMLGTVLNDEVLAAIRDKGAFMDPRSQKDWWPGYPVGLEIQLTHQTFPK